jgi:hypothetical protein
MSLKYVDVAANELTSLVVSGNTTLEILGCENNKLTSLNVSGCTALEKLFASDNELTSLDISGCTALEELDCKENNLTFATLPLFASSSPYYYYYDSQSEITIGINGVISQTNFDELQTQCNAGGGTTTYTWYYEDNTEEKTAVDAGLITNNNGVFTFNDALAGKSIYCVMTNTQFSGLTLKTVTAQVEPIVSPLPTPQNLRSVTASQKTVALDWNDVAGAGSYILQREISPGHWEKIYTGTESKYVDQGLTPETTYSYRVQAVGSAFSETLSVTTLSEDDDDVPVVLKSELNAETKTATLEWVDLGNDYTYYVFRNGALVAQSQMVAGYNDNNLPTTTRYLIYAYNQLSGEWTKSLPVVLSAAPVNAEIVSHEVTSDGGIKLNWNLPDSSQFIIFRNGIPVSGVVSGQTWTDQNPLATSIGNQYTLYVNYFDTQEYSYWTWSAPYVVQKPTTPSTASSANALDTFWADYDFNPVDDDVLNAIA